MRHIHKVTVLESFESFEQMQLNQMSILIWSLQQPEGVCLCDSLQPTEIQILMNQYVPHRHVH